VSQEIDEIRGEITDIATALTGVVDEAAGDLRGIHPAVLSSAGLRAALRALRRRSTIPVDMDVRIDGRLPETVEVGAYYVVSEMLTNAAKHSSASVVEVNAGRVRRHTLVWRAGRRHRRPPTRNGLRAGRSEGRGRSARRHLLHAQPDGGGVRRCPAKLPVPVGDGQPPRTLTTSRRVALTDYRSAA